MKWLNSVSPSQFIDLQPEDPNGHSKKNKKWTQNPKFDLLAKVFSDVLTHSTSSALERPLHLPGKVLEYASNRENKPLGISGLVLSANSPTSGSGVYTPKRYVRLSPSPYHANSCQMFIESYMSNATEDRNSRDSSDRSFKKYGFPVGPNHLGITIGFSAILHSEDFDFSNPKESEKWTMVSSVMDGDKSDFDKVCDDFDLLSEVVQEVADIMQPEAPPILDGRVARVRFRLADQSLAKDNWDESEIASKVEQLASIVAPVLSKIAFT
tara:strand:- start:270 stop:1073 length:804 start_codon:yes stop_codon:yes gene_type:complete